MGGHGLVSHDLSMVCTRLYLRWLLHVWQTDQSINYKQIRAERKQKQPEREGVVSGDIEAVTAPPEEDHYVVVKKKTTKEDAGGEQD